VIGVINSKVADVGMNPARLVRRVEVYGDTTLVTNAVAQTVRQRRIQEDVDAVERVLHLNTCPPHTYCTHTITPTSLSYSVTCAPTIITSANAKVVRSRRSVCHSSYLSISRITAKVISRFY